MKELIKKFLPTRALNIYRKLKGWKEVDWSDWGNYENNIKQKFLNVFGRKLNLKQPKTFSEKMQWLRIYDHPEIMTTLADKYLCRQYVAEKIGEEYLVPLIGVYDKFEEIDFATLPNQFVLKCNHGCGYNLVVYDKSNLDLVDAKHQVEQWLAENHAENYGEIQYRDIKRKIIIEEYLENIDQDIFDYKYFCFNGKPQFIMFCCDRKSGVTKNVLLDINWNNLRVNYFGALLTGKLKKPHNWKLMEQLATRLSQGFRQVRVDFYNINGKIYFGEFTFTSYGGYFNFKPRKWDRIIGDMLILPTDEK